MRRRGLRHFMMGFRLDRMDQIRKFHRVLNEKDGNVVADEIEVSFLGVKFHGKAAYVSREVR